MDDRRTTWQAEQAGTNRLPGIFSVFLVLGLLAALALALAAGPTATAQSGGRDRGSLCAEHRADLPGEPSAPRPSAAEACPPAVVSAGCLAAVRLLSTAVREADTALGPITAGRLLRRAGAWLVPTRTGLRKAGLPYPAQVPAEGLCARWPPWPACASTSPRAEPSAEWESERAIR